MSNLAVINKMLRGIKLVEINIDITALDGETKQIKLKVATNKLNKLAGNGLTSKALYELGKKGTATSEDIHGNKFVYTLGERSMSTDVPVTIPPEETKVEQLAQLQETLNEEAK